MLCNSEDFENVKEIIKTNKEASSKIMWSVEEYGDVETITDGMFNASVEIEIRNGKVRMFPYMIIKGRKVYLEANIK